MNPQEQDFFQGIKDDLEQIKNNTGGGDSTLSEYNYRTHGHCESVPNGTFRDIWSYGATTLGNVNYTWPTTLSAFRIKAGGNVNDTLAGSGARTIMFEFLDDNWKKQTEIIDTAGGSASAYTALSGGRFLSATVLTVGTLNGTNTGAILIENVAGDIVATVQIGDSVSKMSHFSVEAGFEAHLVDVNIQVPIGTNKDVDIILYSRFQGNNFSAPFGAKIEVYHWNAIQGNIPPINLQISQPFIAKTDVWAIAKGNGALSFVTFSIGFEMKAVS